LMCRSPESASALVVASARDATKTSFDGNIFHTPKVAPNEFRRRSTLDPTDCKVP
jgi:hypothetical protein